MAQPDGVIVHGDVAISEIATKRFKITITSPYADKSASGTPSFIKKETVLRTDCGVFFVKKHRQIQKRECGRGVNKSKTQ
ncbi:MAG: hypothetical protein IJU89_01665 [Alphaproteobacteria bacterium]|nr:hypothetical protein [Alphaproteobacteria bacterium]